MLVARTKPNSKATIAVSNFSWGAKYARTAQFKDGRLPTLVDVDIAELDAMLREDYDEVDVNALGALPHNARLIYVRRDSGKPVIGVVVVKHAITEAGEPKTFVAFPQGSVVRLTPAAYASGRMRVGGFSRCWAISSLDISRLYVCKTVSLADRLAAAEVRIEALMEAVSVASGAFAELDARLAASEGRLGAVDDLRLHVSKQHKLIGSLVANVAALKKDGNSRATSVSRARSPTSTDGSD